MKNLLLNLWSDDSGQDMVEYALIAGLVSIIAVAAVTAAGGSVGTIWGKVRDELATAAK